MVVLSWTHANRFSNKMSLWDGIISRYMCVLTKSVFLRCPNGSLFQFSDNSEF